MDDGEFVITDDDDDNKTTANLSMNDGFSSNDDYGDENEQGDARNLINTIKKEFPGMKVLIWCSHI